MTTSSREPLEDSLDDDLFGFGLGDSLDDDPAQSTGASSAVPTAAEPAGEVTIRSAVKFAGVSRYYAILRVPSGSKLQVGVWCCPWSLTKSFLRGGQLFGSGVNLMQFDSLKDAVSHCRTSLRLKTPDPVSVFDSEKCHDLSQSLAHLH